MSFCYCKNISNIVLMLLLLLQVNTDWVVRKLKTLDLNMVFSVNRINSIYTYCVLSWPFPVYCHVAISNEGHNRYSQFTLTRRIYCTWLMRIKNIFVYPRKWWFFSGCQGSRGPRILERRRCVWMSFEKSTLKTGTFILNVALQEMNWIGRILLINLV